MSISAKTCAGLGQTDGRTNKLANLYKHSLILLTVNHKQFLACGAWKFVTRQTDEQWNHRTSVILPQLLQLFREIRYTFVYHTSNITITSYFEAGYSKHLFYAAASKKNHNEKKQICILHSKVKLLIFFTRAFKWSQTILKCISLLKMTSSMYNLHASSNPNV